MEQERGVVDLARQTAAGVVAIGATPLVAACPTARWHRQFNVEAFAKHGVRVEMTAKPKTDLYLALLPLITAGQVELLDDARLITQLVNLERRASRGRTGRPSVDHPPGSGHRDDRVNAAAGALLLARASVFVMPDLSINASLYRRSEFSSGEYR